MSKKPKDNLEITRFLNEHKNDMPFLFTSYDWDDDLWQKNNGFPKLFKLEREISAAAKENEFSKENLLHIAEWGKLPNKTGISRVGQFKFTLYQEGSPIFWLREEPENAICIVEGRIPGFGPTYSSKLLHFAVPEIFGALDTWLVRAFGQGENNSFHYGFLDLKAMRSPKGRWSISPRQSGWPDEYGTWIRILKHISDKLNEEMILCPHPLNFVRENFRKDGIWYPADVETALFSYAFEERGLKILKRLTSDNKQSVTP